MKGRVLSIDALRGVFALLVLTFHCSQWLELPLGEWALSTLRIWGVYAVEGFFIISGMALYLSTRPGQFSTWVGNKNFFAHRYARILPLYALLFAVKPKHAELGWTHLVELFMFFGFVNAAHSTLVGGWSIGVEFVFYLLFPLMALLLRDSAPRAGLLLLATLAALFGHGLLFDLSPPYHSQNNLYVSPINHFAFFVAGYLLGVLHRRDSPWLRMLRDNRRALAAALGLFLLMAWVGGNEHQVQVMGGHRRVLLTLLLILLVGAVAAMTLKGWLAEFLGDISYALYLLHPFVVFGLLPLLNLDSAWVKLGLVYGLTIPLSFLSHRYFEMPAQRFIRRLAHA